MTQRCNICLDETCGGKKNCDCSKCRHFEKCPRFLHPTIRITTKCTQSCRHCLFSCSPDCSDHMSVKTALKVGDFLQNNEISVITLMGGEFFCNPDWKDIFKEIIRDNIFYVRLVTNGDWSEEISDDTMSFLSYYKDIIKISISKDKWHTNKHVKKAEEVCIGAGLKYNVSKDDGECLIPVGRSECRYSFYGTFSCYCKSEDHKYSFLIDESGDIYKCSAGVWPYCNVSEFLKGGFDKRFKEYNMNFNSVFNPGCSSCYRAYQYISRCSEKEKIEVS